MPLKIDAAYHRAWYAKNRETVLARKREAYHADIEKSRAYVRASSKRNYDKNSEKLLAKNKVWVEENREQVNAYNRSWSKRHGIPSMYGIDFLTYSALLICQSGRCSSCNRPLRQPFIDHDHADGKIRGLVCQNCNTIIGHAQDRIPHLVNCIDYLKRFNG